MQDIEGATRAEPEPAVTKNGGAERVASTRRDLNRKTCFVVMPFGVKAHPIDGNPVDFDEIYQKLIKPSVSDLDLDCLRSDEISSAGLIHKEMIEHILKADIVVVDITTGNANVLYELGVRHTARRSGTIILRRRGDIIPFNINGMRVIDYDLDPDSLKQCHSLIVASMRNSLQERNVDSLVHTLIPGLNVTQRPRALPVQRTYVWRCPRMPHRKLCIVTGDLMNVDKVDLWVNPENTKMQMGRWHDSSVSACIRYYGALKDEKGVVTKDLIADALWKKLRPTAMVEPGTVIATTSGLLRRQGVQAILHIAAQHGEPGEGYLTIRSYAKCISSAMEMADDLNNSWLHRLGLRQPRIGLRHPARSIIFPLFGTKADGREPRDVAYNIVQEAKVYFETWPSCTLERVYFLAYTDIDEELVLAAFQRLGLEFEGEE